MTDRADRINATIREIKAAYNNECVVCGHVKPPGDLHGAHIFPRDTHRQLADLTIDLEGIPKGPVIANILPLCSTCHNYVDIEKVQLQANGPIYERPRSPEERILLIRVAAAREHHDRVNLQLDLLQTIVQKIEAAEREGAQI